MLFTIINAFGTRLIEVIYGEYKMTVQKDAFEMDL